MTEASPRQPTEIDTSLWVRMTATMASASFGAAVLIFAVLPFFYNPLRGTTYWGSEFFFLSVGYVLSGPGPDQFRFVVEFGVPILAAVAGVILWTRTGRAISVTRFICSVMAFGGLTYGYLQLRGDWLVGFYAAEAALAVAVVISGLQFVAAFRYRGLVGE